MTDFALLAPRAEMKPILALVVSNSENSFSCQLDHVLHLLRTSGGVGGRLAGNFVNQEEFGNSQASLGPKCHSRTCSGSPFPSGATQAHTWLPSELTVSRKGLNGGEIETCNIRNGGPEPRNWRKSHRISSAE